MGGRIPHRKALFDIAIMGPAMGLVLALPLAVLGIAWSTVYFSRFHACRRNPSGPFDPFFTSD